MSFEDLPGYKEAEALGYELHAYGRSRTMADYTKGKMNLTIYSSGKAKLLHVHGLITFTTGEISFPNENFHLFEKQMLEIINKVK